MTDFDQLIKIPDFDTLFVFNDNLSQFKAFHAWLAGGSAGEGPACAKGGGNAVVRPYQCKDPPLAAGIPTGPGWSTLTTEARRAIDKGLAHIADLVETHDYGYIAYSATPDGGLGTSIFDVGADVKAYILGGLKALTRP